MPPLGISNIAAAPLSVSQAWSRLRGPITGVGTGVCPYADSFGFATPNGVRGFIGPPAGALQPPTRWLVRATGSNNNGGTSASVGRSGSDGVTNGTTTFTSATAAFTSADVGQGICINTGANARHHKIASVTNATTVILDRASSNASALAWVIGGAWADLRPAVGDAAVAADTNSPVLSGDTVSVGAGTYRVVHALGANWSPAFNGQVSIVGDVTGQYTGDAGMVQLTAYTTNDKTAPAATTLLNLNGKSNLAFSNVMFVGGSALAGLVTATTATSQNISFTDCAFQVGSTGATNVVSFTNAYPVPFRLVFDRCVFPPCSNTAVIAISAASGSAQDYDCGVSVLNCIFPNYGNVVAVRLIKTGALSGVAGGVRIRNVFASGSSIFFATVTGASTVFPCFVYNTTIFSPGGTGMNAQASGQIVEDYNLIFSSAPRTNVTAGAHSISDGSYAPLFHAGQERIWGGLLRPFGEPMAGSPLLGFGNDGGQTPYDLYNRPRPAGGGSGNPLPAVGALERGNTSAQASSPAPPTGTYDWQFTGPGFQEFLLPVSNTSTTVSINVQRDSTYSPYPGGTLPALQILANGRLGIPAQTIVDTGSSGGWNTLTAQAFTPSGTGWVTVRIASYDGIGSSVVSFSNLVVS